MNHRDLKMEFTLFYFIFDGVLLKAIYEKQISLKMNNSDSRLSIVIFKFKIAIPMICNQYDVRVYNRLMDNVKSLPSIIYLLQCDLFLDHLLLTINIDPPRLWF